MFSTEQVEKRIQRSLSCRRIQKQSVACGAWASEARVKKTPSWERMDFYAPTCASIYLFIYLLIVE